MYGPFKYFQNQFGIVSSFDFSNCVALFGLINVLNTCKVTLSCFQRISKSFRNTFRMLFKCCSGTVGTPFVCLKRHLPGEHIKNIENAFVMTADFETPFESNTTSTFKSFENAYKLMLSCFQCRSKKLSKHI